MTQPDVHLTMADLIDLGNGYFTHDLSAGRVELFRADGYSFGDTGREYVDQVVRGDQASPAPGTGTTLAKRFASKRTPSSSVAGPPADQPVEVPVEDIVAPKKRVKA